MPQILVNGLLKRTDYYAAYKFLKEADNWIAAYPHGKGFPTGVVRPLFRQHAPIHLTSMEILGIMPYVEDVGEDIAHSTMPCFAFAALVTIDSSEQLAIDYAIEHAYWLAPNHRSLFTDITWSKAATVGSFHHLTSGATP